ncbi:MAG: putative colanic acid biosynthesis acetyltransferase [Candidatus Omnitrophica bacterium]|nr:putative colanic acid biosynthesis acetyltransferase [Candidatus Omnitrophota bacterium]
MELNSCFYPSFSFKNRSARFFWNIVWLIFFRFTPRFFYLWRSILLSFFGARIGKKCRISPGVRIWAPWNLRLGNAVVLSADVFIYNQARVVVGDGAVVSYGTQICTGSHNYRKKSFPLITRPIRIESRVWVCAQVFILGGVTIGEGAVVGARSVVTSDLSPWQVYAGNPARAVDTRIIVE